MRIGRNSYVKFEYVLRNKEGELLEASEMDNPPTYVHGYQQLVPGLEQSMQEHSEGDRFECVVAAKHGYGLRDESLLVRVPRNQVPTGVGLNKGQSFEAVNDHGHVIKLYINEVTDTEVVMDANHPLAGVELHYTITVKEVRPANESELMAAAAPVMGTEKEKGKA